MGGGGLNGTDSHFRAMVALDEVERGHFSLDTVRAQGPALREGGPGPQRVCSRARHIVRTHPSQASVNQNPCAAALSVSHILPVLSRTPAWRGAGTISAWSCLQKAGQGRPRQPRWAGSAFPCGLEAGIEATILKFKISVFMN